MTFSFKPLDAADLPMLIEWLHRPHVAGRHSVEAGCWSAPPATIEAAHAEFIADTGSKKYVAYLDEAPIGYIQSYVAVDAGDGWWPDETDPGTRGIDQFLADADRLNQGIGTAMIVAFVARLFEDPAVTKVQADPAPDNARAIRAYEKAGFTRIGVVSTPDGPAQLLIRNR